MPAPAHLAAFHKALQCHSGSTQATANSLSNVKMQAKLCICHDTQHSVNSSLSVVNKPHMLLDAQDPHMLHLAGHVQELNALPTAVGKR